MPYLPDVNARVLGFTHGQLISSLSKNIEAADMFDYNGLQDWSRHSRYRRYDQVQRPIALTNWAHAAGSSYAVSAHPDFAVRGIDRKKTVVMTYFFWNRDKKSRLGGKNADLPHFIFQIVQIPGV